MDLTVITFLVTVIFICVFYLTFQNFNYWKAKGFPFIKTVPVFEVVCDILFKKKCCNQTFLEVYNKLDGHKFGGFILFWKPILMICDPDLINHVLISDFAYFQNRGNPAKNFEPLSGNVSCLTGETWRNVRYKLTPVFSCSKVKLMFDQIKDCSCIITEYMKTKDGPFEVRYFMHKFSVNVIASVALGICPHRCRKTDEKKNALFEISARYFSPSFAQIMKFLFRLSFPKASDFLKVQLIDDEVNNFFINLVHDTIDFRKKTGHRRNDFLQLMMDLRETENLNHLNKIDHSISVCTGKSKNTVHQNELEDAQDTELLEQVKHSLCRTADKLMFTDALIAAQVFSFLTIGSEAISNTMSFALYHLAVDTAVQNRLQNEIDSVLSTQEFTYDCLKKMTYMDQVINEVLRLHPIYGGISRECDKDYIIPGTDKVIEKGAMVLIPVVALHTDPKYFPDPEKFNPDRFEDMNSIPKGVFFPFGDGPRICIAIRFATLEMKVFLTQLLSEYNLTLSDKTQLPLKTVSNSLSGHIVGGLWINFKLRQKDSS